MQDDHQQRVKHHVDGNAQQVQQHRADGVALRLPNGLVNVDHEQKRHIKDDETHVRYRMVEIIRRGAHPSDDTRRRDRHHRRAQEREEHRDSENLVGDFPRHFRFARADVLADHHRARDGDAAAEVDDRILHGADEVDGGEVIDTELPQPVGVGQVVHRLQEAVDDDGNRNGEHCLDQRAVQD